MGENSTIEWCDHTFNPWTGCAKVSEGCRNCYAERWAKRFPHAGNWGPGAERKLTSEGNRHKPLAWNRKAADVRCERCNCKRREHGRGLLCPAFVGPARPRVFCASLADWLDPEVPAEWLADLLALIAATPHLDWLLLTKRPELWGERLDAAVGSVDPCGLGSAMDWVDGWLDGNPPPNVWLGVTVEDQANADKRIPELLKTPARVRFLSCEPLLGPVDLTGRGWGGCFHASDDQQDDHSLCAPTIHWVICGGESGPGARPTHPNWARGLRDQCQKAGVAFLFKQHGAWKTDGYDRDRDDPDWRNVPDSSPEGRRWLNVAGGDGFHGDRVVLAERLGKKCTGRLLDGRTWDEVPS